MGVRIANRHIETFPCVSLFHCDLNYYCLPTKLQEGNVFSHVSVSHSVDREVSAQGADPPLCSNPALYSTVSQPPLQGPSPPLQGPTKVLIQTCLTWTSLYSPPPTISPRDVQTYSLGSTDCQKVGGWHLTEIPSCFKICFRF